MTAAGGVRRANPPWVRSRRPTSRLATRICPVRPANDTRPAWAIRWAAAVTPQYPSHEACAAGPCIYILAFDRRPRLANALEEAMCIDAGILAHCREPGEHMLRLLPPAAASVSQWTTVESRRRCRRTGAGKSWKKCRECMSSSHGVPGRPRWAGSISASHEAPLPSELRPKLAIRFSPENTSGRPR
jgi:hypothetical protein